MNKIKKFSTSKTQEMFKMNKQGIVHIPVLVMLTLVLCVSALFLFLNATDAEKYISGATAMNSFEYSEKQTNFFLNQIGEKAVVESYVQFVKNSDDGNRYIGNLQLTDNKPIFEKLDDKLGEKFSAEVKKNFIFYFDSNVEGWENLDFSELKKKIDAGEFDISYKDGKINILFRDFKIQKNFGTISISGKLQNLEINLNDVYLESFEKIYSAKEKCKTKASVEEIKKCFNDELLNFEITGTQEIKIGDKIYNYFTFSSKREFGNKIDFGFIVK